MADWYEEVDPVEPVSQGDLLPGLLIPAFSEFDAASGKDKIVQITLRLDVLVLSQACDLAQRNVARVLVCAAPTVGIVKEAWERKMRRDNQNPTNKAWKKQHEKFKNYELARACLLGAYEGGISSPERVADFRELHTVERTYLESTIVSPRLRLRNDFRNHVSQRLGAFFSRVGLPD